MGMKLVMIMGAVMVVMTLAFSWYYKDTQKRMGVLYENNAKLEVSVKANELALATTRADAARNAALNFQLQTKLQESEAYGDRLQAIFQKHNLTVLSLKKPGLIEKRMNDATKKLFADITADTTH
jgi:accessory colonization factor AcfC